MKTLASQSLPETLPPVVLFAFNRPDTLQVVIEALERQQLKPSTIIVFLDGPRVNHATDANNIRQCKAILSQAKGLNIILTKRSQNLGCNGNIIEGLKSITQEYPMFMVLEDDVVPSPYYYDSMCRLLEMYKDEKAIFSLLPLTHQCYSDSFLQKLKCDFFITNRFNPQGYASWSNRWTDDLWGKLATSAHNPFGHFFKIPFTPYLLDVIDTQVYIEQYHPDEWAMALVLECLSQNQLHICTQESMVYNIGFGRPDATNTRHPSPGYNKRYNANYQPQDLPKELVLDAGLKEPISILPLSQRLKLFLRRCRQCFRSVKYRLCRRF